MLGAVPAVDEYVGHIGRQQEPAPPPFPHFQDLQQQQQQLQHQVQQQLELASNNNSDLNDTQKVKSRWTRSFFTALDRRHSEERYICDVCHKDLASPSTLKLHRNTHVIERRYKCDPCQVSFHSQGHLQKHKRSSAHETRVQMTQTFGIPTSDNPRPYGCPECDIAFRKHGHLAKHLRSKSHITKLEASELIPLGTYAALEKCGNLELKERLVTTNCEQSLQSLRSIAMTLFQSQPMEAAHQQCSAPEYGSTSGHSPRGLVSPAPAMRAAGHRAPAALTVGAGSVARGVSATLPAQHPQQHLPLELNSPPQPLQGNHFHHEQQRHQNGNQLAPLNFRAELMRRPQQVQRDPPRAPLEYSVPPPIAATSSIDSPALVAPFSPPPAPSYAALPMRPPPPPPQAHYLGQQLAAATANDATSFRPFCWGAGLIGPAQAAPHRASTQGPTMDEQLLYAAAVASSEQHLL